MDIVRNDSSTIHPEVWTAGAQRAASSVERPPWGPVGWMSGHQPEFQKKVPLNLADGQRGGKVDKKPDKSTKEIGSSKEGQAKGRGDLGTYGGA